MHFKTEKAYVQGLVWGAFSGRHLMYFDVMLSIVPLKFVQLGMVIGIFLFKSFLIFFRPVFKSHAQIEIIGKPKNIF